MPQKVLLRLLLIGVQCVTAQLIKNRYESLPKQRVKQNERAPGESTSNVPNDVTFALTPTDGSITSNEMLRSTPGQKRSTFLQVQVAKKEGEMQGESLGEGQTEQMSIAEGQQMSEQMQQGEAMSMGQSEKMGEGQQLSEGQKMSKLLLRMTQKAVDMVRDEQGYFKIQTDNREAVWVPNAGSEAKEGSLGLGLDKGGERNVPPAILQDADKCGNYCQFGNNRDIVASYMPTEPKNTEKPTLPTEVENANFFDYAYLSPLINQHIPHYCGSCPYTSALGSLQDRINININRLRSHIQEDNTDNSPKAPIYYTPVLSVQNILDCGAYDSIGASCCGGFNTDVYQYLMNRASSSNRGNNPYYRAEQLRYVPVNSYNRYISYSANIKSPYILSVGENVSSNVGRSEEEIYQSEYVKRVEEQCGKLVKPEEALPAVFEPPKGQLSYNDTNRNMVPAWTIAGYANVKQDMSPRDRTENARKRDTSDVIREMKFQLYNYGPLVCSICSGIVRDYMGGILRKGNPVREQASTPGVCKRHHLLVIVGWGVEDGVDYDKDAAGTSETIKQSETESVHYWLVRNTWGHYWGELGYMRIEMGHQAEIESQCTYAYPKEGWFDKRVTTSGVPTTNGEGIILGSPAVENQSVLEGSFLNSIQSSSQVTSLSLNALAFSGVPVLSVAFDWRTQLALTPVIDQNRPQKCNSGWAIAVVGAVSDRIRIKTKEKLGNSYINIYDPRRINVQIELSTQHMLNTVDHGCGHEDEQANTIQQAIDTWMALPEGLAFDTSMPYLACDRQSTNGFCKAARLQGDFQDGLSNVARSCDAMPGIHDQTYCWGFHPYPAAKIQAGKGFEIPGDKIDHNHLKNEIRGNGPLPCQLDGNLEVPGATNMKTGVVVPSLKGPAKSYVTIVGWGKEHWIARTSLGEGFGDYGYIYIPLTTKLECFSVEPTEWTGKELNEDKRLRETDRRPIRPESPDESPNPLSAWWDQVRQEEKEASPAAERRNGPNVPCNSIGQCFKPARKNQSANPLTPDRERYPYPPEYLVKPSGMKTIDNKLICKINPEACKNVPYASVAVSAGAAHGTSKYP